MIAVRDVPSGLRGRVAAQWAQSRSVRAKLTLTTGARSAALNLLKR